VWIKASQNRSVCRNTVRKLIRNGRLSWKKCKKLLGKRNPQKRADHMKKFHELYDRMIRGEIQLVFVDESHFHRDMDLGYTWGRVGKRVWRISDCPPLSDRINWYGAFNFGEGQSLIWNEGNCDKEHTAMFLERLKTWLPADGSRIVVIWDGAPWHRAKSVQTKADALGIELIPLPGYSPDLNPIEGLWKWMREDVTQLCCHSSIRGLFDDCKDFIERVNRNPLAMIDRLWPRFELDPEAEKLLFSE
jgi:transposase